MPETTNKIPDDPRIKISLKGLGVLCVHNNQAEIGYIPIESHSTIIKICKITADGNKKILKNETMKSDLTVKSSTSDTCQFYQNGSDKENFSNMIDLSEGEFYEGASFKPEKKYSPAIYVLDSVFFTEPTSLIDIFKVNLDTGDRTPLTGIGTILRGYTKNEKASFIYDCITYMPDSNESFEVSISSDCRGVSADDFVYHHDYLSTTKPKYNIEKPENLSAWITEDEYKEFQEIVAYLSEIASKDFERFDDGIDVDEINNYLDILKDKFCTPKPCLFVTFADIDRSIPV